MIMVGENHLIKLGIRNRVGARICALVSARQGRVNSH